MSLHGDLLEQAGRLARQEPRKPKQASLRRAVSAAYYALFHLLINEATRLFLSGVQREALRLRLARAFRHSAMKHVSQAFARGQIPRKLHLGVRYSRSLDSSPEPFVTSRTPATTPITT